MFHTCSCCHDFWLSAGGSLSSCFSDVAVLDTEAKQWLAPRIVGAKGVSPRAGHSGAIVGNAWYIVGGGNNVKGKQSPGEDMGLMLCYIGWRPAQSLDCAVKNESHSGVILELLSMFGPSSSSQQLLLLLLLLQQGARHMPSYGACQARQSMRLLLQCTIQRTLGSACNMILSKGCTLYIPFTPCRLHRSPRPGPVSPALRRPPHMAHPRLHPRPRPLVL
jgi:hypothetical protein